MIQQHKVLPRRRCPECNYHWLRPRVRPGDVLEYPGRCGYCSTAKKQAARAKGRQLQRSIEVEYRVL